MLKESPQFPTESPPSRMKELLPSLKNSGACTTKVGWSRKNISTLPSLNSEGGSAEEATTAGPEQRSLCLRKLQGRRATQSFNTGRSDTAHREGGGRGCFPPIRCSANWLCAKVRPWLLFFGCAAMWLAGPSFSNQGSNPRPLQGKCRVLATGLLGNPLKTHGGFSIHSHSIRLHLRL